MQQDHLWSPKLKIERAKSHIEDLETALKSYFAASPYGVRRDLDNNGRDEHLIVHATKPVPNKVYSIVGDAIHNLRASLDHLAVALARVNGATKISDVCFPFARLEKDFEAIAKEKIKRLSPEAAALISTLKPYPGGNDLLFALHELDITDKHRRIVPVATAIGGGRGVLSIKAPARISTSFIFGNLEKGIHWMTVPVGTEVKYDFDVATDIALAEVEAVKDKPVTPTLEQLVGLVGAIVLLFEKRFFST